MPTTFVAIDLETTGLDPESDTIIEVAAVTFQGADVLDEFTTLVNPQRPIPPQITRLTGITNSMVTDAPTMFNVRSRLRQVLGNHVLVGHNVRFDLGFLQAESLATRNLAIDTLTLATILVPEAGRYGLDALSRHLNLPRPEGGQSHRALDDAILTVELFLALWERALQLPPILLQEIVEAGRRINWPETIFFEEALTAVTGNKSLSRRRLSRLFAPTPPEGKPLVPRDELTLLDVETISGMLRPGGNFSRAFPAFEYRPQQVEMVAAVAEAFNQGEHILIEAGTGTGKSIGYLLPAVFWAHQNGRRVVISTNTINLQDQLIHKDIPELQKLLPFDIRACVRKGRSNYLCTRLFQQMRHSGPTNADEMALFARILLWLPQTETGDVAELNLRTAGERIAWARLSAENAACTAEQCAVENCPLQLAKRRAETSHLIVVNHALLLSDIATNNQVLPEFYDLIVDEAHHLESAVTEGLSFRADKRYLETILREVAEAKTGLIGDVQGRVRESVPPAVFAQWQELIGALQQEARLALVRLEEFFDTLRYFLQDFSQGKGQFAEQIRLVSAVRAQPDYSEVELSWDNLGKQLKKLVVGFEELATGLAELIEQFDITDGEDLVVALASNGRSLEEIRTHLDNIVATPDEDQIYWVEIFRDRISLHAAPLHVGPLVEKYIFMNKETVILTSATLRTAPPDAREEATFDYIRQRLHAREANELAVGSPFDYKNSTLLYLPTDIPEPNQPGYQQYVEQAILDVAKVLGGRTMALFTSYSQLAQTARAIEQPLSEMGITLLAQSEGMSRQQMLAQFKEVGEKTVLLGTRSFWEGVDVPGEALQALLIARLPFDVPSDPIFAARSETFDSPFFEYSIPEAVLRFRQGFGRLIRRQSDEGVVVVLDKRVLTKRYGQLFLAALPECTVLRQRIGRLGELTLRWLNRDRTKVL
ncbi:MAG: hypothetical protein D6706_00720 [Chloroflexi bacterium]|nr:MAG: hypothetical protein D6706_00720 [Chloroflexota bacterium]